MACKTVDLYGEDGIKIGLTAEFDLCSPHDAEAVTVVAGHALYVCSVQEAEHSIQDEYMQRLGKAWHPHHGWIAKTDPAMGDEAK